VTLDRPERLNAFNGPLRRSIRAIIDDAAVDADVRVFVLTGAGRGFCSGADLTADDRRRERGGCRGWAGPPCICL
jgi:enoyl-CoA hydratase/carnithine racemase